VIESDFLGRPVTVLDPGRDGGTGKVHGRDECDEQPCPEHHANRECEDLTSKTE
jgi:hypothetical protein